MKEALFHCQQTWGNVDGDIKFRPCHYMFQEFWKCFSKEIMRQKKLNVTPGNIYL